MVWERRLYLGGLDKTFTFVRNTVHVEFLSKSREGQVFGALLIIIVSLMPVGEARKKSEKDRQRPYDLLHVESKK